LEHEALSTHRFESASRADRFGEEPTSGFMHLFGII